MFETGDGSVDYHGRIELVDEPDSDILAPAHLVPHVVNPAGPAKRFDHSNRQGDVVLSHSVEVDKRVKLIFRLFIGHANSEYNETTFCFRRGRSFDSRPDCEFGE